MYVCMYKLYMYVCITNSHGGCGYRRWKMIFYEFYYLNSSSLRNFSLNLYLQSVMFFFPNQKNW